MGEVKALSHEHVYRSIVESTNAILGRSVITMSGLQTLFQECMYVRQTHGQMGLVRFAQGIPPRFLSPAEIEHLQHDPRFPELAKRVILLAVEENIVRPREARTLHRILTSHTGKKANGKRRLRW